MKIDVTTAILVVLCSVATLLSNDIYQQIRVYYSDRSDLLQITEVGIPLDHVRMKKGIFIDVAATRQQVGKLRNLGFRVEILQENLSEFFKRRFDPGRRMDRGFELGSMGGNYTYEEMEKKLDALHERYPELVSEKQSIGLSVEGRNIWAVKISDNAGSEINQGGDLEPLVLYTGVTHAREPITMMNLIYYMDYLCKNYPTDETVNHVVNNRELWFIPIVNPDGYVYNQAIEPEGGGMHRKNRKNTGCGQSTGRGVDLNRNFGYTWGFDNLGSSPDPCSETFRGDSAFSEAETSVLRDFMLSKNFKNVLHYHSYSNVLIHSYGSGENPPEPDLTMLREYGAEMTRYNHYRVGTGSETIGYTVNGDAVDYAYEDLGLIAYTPEIGTYDDYFWPPTDRIVPLCEENVWPNLHFARVAGPFFQIADVNINQEKIEPGDSVTVSLSIRNIGLHSSYGAVNASIEPLNWILDFKTRNTTINGLDRWESIAFPGGVVGVVNSTARGGCRAGLKVNIYDSNVNSYIDTISFIVGIPVPDLIDDAEFGMNKWETTDWGRSPESYDGNYSITDTPGDSYPSNTSSALRLTEPIDLSESLHSELKFWAKWDIEPVWDFVQVQASSDGYSWIPLSGKYTKGGSGNGAQTRDEPGYDGLQLDWVEELLDLSFFDGESEVYIRFVLSSDWSVEGDGFYFDNLEILAFSSSNISSGDVNQDCVIDVTDIMSMVDMILFPDFVSNLERRISDLNHDSVVNVFDIILLVDTILDNE